MTTRHIQSEARSQLDDRYREAQNSRTRAVVRTTPSGRRVYGYLPFGDCPVCDQYVEGGGYGPEHHSIYRHRTHCTCRSCF